MKETIQFDFTREQIVHLMQYSLEFRELIADKLFPPQIKVNDLCSVTREQAAELKGIAKTNKITAIKKLRDMFAVQGVNFGDYPSSNVGLREAKDFIEGLMRA
jgi:hypothetical protein